MYELNDINILNSLPDGLTILDLELNIVFVNKTTANLVGYSPDELKEKKIDRILTPDSFKIAMEIYKEELEKEKTEKYNPSRTRIENLENYRKDGSTIWLETHVSFLRGKDMKPTGILVISRDITERKKLEKKLEESQRWYKTLFDTSVDMIVIHDLNGNILDVNKTTYEIFGFNSSDEFIKNYKNVLNVINHDEVDKAVFNMNETLKHGFIRANEYSFLDKNNEKIFIEEHTSLLKDSDGNPFAFLSIARNITERKKYEIILKENELKYRILFEYANDAIFIMDKEIFIDCNKKTLEIFGCSKDQIIGKPPYLFSPPVQPDGRDSKEKAIEKITEALKGKPQVFEWLHCKYDGTLFYTEVSLNSLELSDKIYIQAIVRDIDARKKVEKELIESENRYRLLIESTSDLIILHDMNGIIQYVNQAVVNSSGYTKEELIGKNIILFTPKENEKQIIERSIKRKSGDYKIEQYETEFINKSGKLNPVQVTSTPILKEGKIESIMLVVHDLRQLKIAEDLLIKNKERLEATISILQFEPEDSQDLLEHVVKKAIVLSGSKFGFLMNQTIAENNSNIIVWERDFEGNYNIINKEVFDLDCNEIWNENIKNGKPFIVNDYEEFVNKKRMLKESNKENKDAENKNIKIKRFLCIPLFKNRKLITILGVSNKEEDYTDIDILQLTLLMDAAQKSLERLDILEKLLESEANYRLIVDNQTDLVVKVDKDYKFLYVNPVYCRTFGKKENELINSSFTPFVHQEDIEKTLKEMKKLFIPPYQARMQQRALTVSGWRWFEWVDTAILGEKNEVKEIIGVGRDITEQKQFELALKESEQKFKILTDSNPSAILMYQENKWIYANPASEKLTGYKIDELSKMNFWDIVHPLDKEIVIERGSKRQKGESTVNNYQFRIISKSGEVRWVDLYGASVQYNGKPSAIISVLDITDRKNAEEKLEEEKEKLNITLQSIGDGVIATDTDGKVALMNEAAQKLTGYTFDESIGKGIHEIFDIHNELSGESIENPVKKVLQTGKIVELSNNTVLISKSGEKIIITDSAAPIKDKEGKIFGVVLVFRDITEKIQLLNHIQQTQKLESMGILAAGIAHDFNNLLEGVFGHIELAIEYLKDGKKGIEQKEQIMEILAEAVDSIQRSKALTDQLLTFAKGGEPIKKLQSIVPLLKNISQFAISGSKVKTIFNIDENLSDVEFDYNQMAQVIENIIINAVQAMPEGGQIEIGAENANFNKDEHPILSGKYIKISIKDTGIGIPKELLPKIFDLFFTTKNKGSGLGLPTCYSIVSKHNGTIEVESQFGKGTTFYIFLPVNEGQYIKTLKDESNDQEIRKYNTDKTNITTSAVKEKSAGMKKKYKILLLEDEEVLQKLFKKFLEPMGFEVITAIEGKEAIEKFYKDKREGRPFDLLLFDMTIKGGISGNEAVMEIRKDDPDVLAFVMSGYHDDPVFSNPEKYGFNGGLRKPFTIKDLKDLLGRYFPL